MSVAVADPLADPDEVGARVWPRPRPSSTAQRYDLVVGAVAHRDYRELAGERLASCSTPGGTLADLKGMWRGRRSPGDRSLDAVTATG